MHTRFSKFFNAPYIVAEIKLYIYNFNMIDCNERKLELMIKSIRLENFFSFKDTTIELNKNENIFIGINGSGKSNLLKAIHLLKEGVSGIGLKKLIFDTWGGFDGICFCGDKEDSEQKSIVLTFELDWNKIKKIGFPLEKNIIYRIAIHRAGSTSNYYISEELFQDTFNFIKFEEGKGVLMYKGYKLSEGPYYKEKEYFDFDPQELALSQINDPDRYFMQSTIRKAIRETVVYNYFDTTTRSSIRKPMLSTSEKRLLPDGSNLSQILNTINIGFKKDFKKIRQILNDVNSNFKDIDFHFIGGNIELMLEEESLNKSIHVTHISDGTLRFLCLLAIFFNPDRGKFICIDEPEMGLHPDMILNITNALKEASDETQFIIATHSENIVNNFELENIRVLEKNANNETIVNSFTEEDFEGWYEEYFPGRMWRKGDLGGNRW